MRRFFARPAATEIERHQSSATGLRALSRLKQRFARRALTRKAETAIAAHLPALKRLRLERVTCDQAGRVDAQAWANEVVYFILNQIQPTLSAGERHLLAQEHDRIAWLVADQVEAVARRSPDFYRFAARSESSALS